MLENKHHLRNFLGPGLLGLKSHTGSLLWLYILFERQTVPIRKQIKFHIRWILTYGVLGVEWDVKGVGGVTSPVRTSLARFSNSIGSSRPDVELMTLNLEFKLYFSFTNEYLKATDEEQNVIVGFLAIKLAQGLESWRSPCHGTTPDTTDWRHFIN